MSTIEPEVLEGWIDEAVRAEFPGLRLRALEVEAHTGRSSRELRQRLRTMSDRFMGAHAIAMRSQPIPHAYRVFYRHVGLDPDATRTPVEEAAVERLVKGRFRSRNVLDDALTIALVETGVPIWALDAERVDGPVGIRPARAGESLGEGEYPAPLPEGRLVVADAARPLGTLFGELAPGAGVSPSTARMVLFSVQVAGVPEIHVEEALWSCISTLRAG